MHFEILELAGLEQPVSIKEIYNVLEGSCTYFSFVKRSNQNVLIAREVEQTLRKYFVSRKQVTVWPGTKLLSDSALIQIYELSRESVSLLSRFSDDFFCWAHPHLFEDLIFYRNDFSEMFITISHEKDAYFLLNKTEYLSVQKSWPSKPCLETPNFESLAIGPDGNWRKEKSYQRFIRDL